MIDYGLNRLIPRTYVMAMLFVMSFSLPVQAMPSSDSVVSDDAYLPACLVRNSLDEYAGKVVRFHVRYVSDQIFYGYIFDDACRSQKAIEVEHFIRTHGDESVVAFFRAEKEKCEKVKSVVCPVEADLDVEALIIKNPDGSPIVEFKKINNYEFL